ncbi:unnamed protein product, partial [Amoebophrya sp. A120]
DPYGTFWSRIGGMLFSTHCAPKKQDEEEDEEDNAPPAPGHQATHASHKDGQPPRQHDGQEQLERRSLDDENADRSSTLTTTQPV